MESQDRMSFPGSLGYASESAYIIAIHADWPAYPAPPGPLNSLYDLCQFPSETTFTAIDDIDRCILFLADGLTSNSGDPWAENAFHVAVWHMDLLALQDDDCISGITELTEREWEERRREELRRRIRDDMEGEEVEGDPLDLLITVTPDGEYKPVRLPPLPDDDEAELFPVRGWVGTEPSRPVMVTQTGWSTLERALEEDTGGSLPGRAEGLFELGYYDIAVRELAVILEESLRTATLAGERLSGQPLVARYVNMLEAANCLTNAAAKRLRTELRTAFKFVRNEFAHNRVDIPRGRALALTRRLAILIDTVETVRPGE